MYVVFPAQKLCFEERKTIFFLKAFSWKILNVPSTTKSAKSNGCSVPHIKCTVVDRILGSRLSVIKEKRASCDFTELPGSLWWSNALMCYVRDTESKNPYCSCTFSGEERNQKLTFSHKEYHWLLEYGGIRNIAHFWNFQWPTELLIVIVILMSINHQEYTRKIIFDSNM